MKLKIIDYSKDSLLIFLFSILSYFNFSDCYAQFSNFNIADNENVATIDGVYENSRLGYDVSAIGDLNNDGVDDIALCATYATPGSILETGEIYIIFGHANIQIDQFDLTSLNGSNGFKVRGINAEHRLGYGGAARGGDINNDGIDDVVLSTPYTEYEGHPDQSQALNNGSAYIIFGQEDPYPEFFDLSSLNGSNGFRIIGWEYWENAGTLAGGAGDLNADGIDDVYVSADDANAINSGNVYIVYGKDGVFPADIVTNQITQNIGFTIKGAAADDNLGISVAPLEDINSDGINDIVMGGWYANNQKGGAYVIYGTVGNTYTNLSVSNLNGSNGFAVEGNLVGDFFGSVVGDAGDLNHDGIHDLFIGARKESNVGKLYVIYGKTTDFPANIIASTISTNYGIVISGGSSGDFAGWDASSLGDFNGDGVDDLVLSSVFAESDANLNASGLVHVIYGDENGLPSQIGLDNISESQGFQIEGSDSKARLGFSVSGNFDLNGDGANDLLIGADYGGSTSFTNGRAYIIFNNSCLSVNLYAWLEGPYNHTIGRMNSDLSSIRTLLPGQTPASNLSAPTPPGQPYSVSPWHYQGSEGENWTDLNYTGEEVDWILVSLRTGIEKSTEIDMAAGLLKADGSITFPDGDLRNPTNETHLYVVIDHRNHMGVMTPQAIEIINGVLTYDFRVTDSYHDSTSFGQKEKYTGKWMMYAGDADKSDLPSYDIQGSDKVAWDNANGTFGRYIFPDFDLDGDVTGNDKILWANNNGISSRVLK